MAQAQDLPREPSACQVVATESGQQIEFQGVVAASSGVTGQYRLEIRKSGPSGSVSSSQTGTFTTKPSASLPVGRMVISVEPGASYNAVLTIDAGGRSYTCKKQGSGRAQ